MGERLPISTLAFLYAKAVFPTLGAIGSVARSVLTKGPWNVFYQNHVERPAVLDEPSLGIHGFIQLEVSLCLSPPLLWLSETQAAFQHPIHQLHVPSIYSLCNCLISPHLWVLTIVMTCSCSNSALPIASLICYQFKIQQVQTPPSHGGLALDRWMILYFVIRSVMHHSFIW